MIHTNLISQIVMQHELTATRQRARDLEQFGVARTVALVRIEVLERELRALVVQRQADARRLADTPSALPGCGFDLGGGPDTGVRAGQ